MKQLTVTLSDGTTPRFKADEWDWDELGVLRIYGPERSDEMIHVVAAFAPGAWFSVVDETEADDA